MKDRGVLRTVSLLAASLVAAASLMTAPVTAAGSEAEEVLGRLSGTASVSQIPASPTSRSRMRSTRLDRLPRPAKDSAGKSQSAFPFLGSADVSELCRCRG